MTGDVVVILRSDVYAFIVTEIRGVVSHTGGEARTLSADWTEPAFGLSFSSGCDRWSAYGSDRRPCGGNGDCQSVAHGSGKRLCSSFGGRLSSCSRGGLDIYRCCGGRSGSGDLGLRLGNAPASTELDHVQRALLAGDKVAAREQDDLARRREAKETFR